MRNLFIGIMNAILVNLVFVGLWLYVSNWAAENHFGILHWLETTFDIPIWFHAVGAILLLDVWLYVWHRINHIIPFLWRFHRLHHSDPTMDVTTAGRFHPGEIVFSSVLRIPLIILSGVYLWELVLCEQLSFRRICTKYTTHAGNPKPTPITAPCSPFGTGSSARSGSIPNRKRFVWVWMNSTVGKIKPCKGCLKRRWK